MVAVGKVGAADRALKQHVADDGKAQRFAGEDEVARRVAGAVQDGEVEARDLDRVALDEEAIDRRVPDPLDAVSPRLRLDPLQEKAVARVRPLDRQRRAGLVPPRAFKVLDPAGVVDVAVRQDDLGRLRPRLLDRRQDARHVAAGVDHRRSHRGVVPQDGAVLLKRRDGDDRAFEGHWGSFRWRC